VQEFCRVKTLFQDPNDAIRLPDLNRYRIAGGHSLPIDMSLTMSREFRGFYLRFRNVQQVKTFRILGENVALPQIALITRHGKHCSIKPRKPRAISL
jgi:hypothetical protein